jgi:predicted nuclease with TOPRIM domain
MRTLKLVSLLTLSYLVSFAQPSDEEMKEKRETMMSMKIGYITKELSLTTLEAQKFWPVYNELEDKIDVFRNENREMNQKLRRDGAKVQDFSDAELQEMAKKNLDNDEKIIKLRREYHDRFVKTIGIQKTTMLYMAERDFHREMLRKGRGQDNDYGKGNNNGKGDPKGSGKGDGNGNNNGKGPNN